MSFSGAPASRRDTIIEMAALACLIEIFAGIPQLVDVFTLDNLHDLQSNVSQCSNIAFHSTGSAGAFAVICDSRRVRRARDPHCCSHLLLAQNGLGIFRRNYAPSAMVTAHKYGPSQASVFGIFSIRLPS